MRFSKLFPKTRLLGLSATLPNVSDFRTWFTNLNGNKTVVINSKWRPTKLDWHVMFTDSMQKELPGQPSQYTDSRMNAVLVLVAEKAKLGEKCLVFVHSKKFGRELAEMLSFEGHEAKFHNADVAKADRIEYEQAFAKKEGGLEVLVSTSTLAWGRSLPARNVIIAGTKRGFEEVDVLDILQMGGRAGRFGMDPKGDAYLIVQGSAMESQQWRTKLENMRPVKSQLLNQDTLGFHFIAEIANKVILDEKSARKWFDATLAIVQSKPTDAMIMNVFDWLKSLGMIRQKDDKYSVTALGRISADYYLLPRDVVHWDRSGAGIAAKNVWSDDVAISWFLAGMPSKTTWPGRGEELRQYSLRCAKIFGGEPSGYMSPVGLALWKFMKGQPAEHIILGVLADMPRIGQACSRLKQIRGWDVDIDDMLTRAEYGVPGRLVKLCRITGIGRVRAEQLFSGGMSSPRSVADNPALVTRILGQNTGNKAVRAAKLFIRREALTS